MRERNLEKVFWGVRKPAVVYTVNKGAAFSPGDAVFLGPTFLMRPFLLTNLP